MKDIKIFLKGCGIFFAFLASAYTLHAQDAYRIEFDVKGLGEEPVILGTYYGESAYVYDTSVYENGIHVFQGNEPLTKGMYFIAKGKQRLLDLVVYNDQNFRLSTDTSNYVMNLSVSGDTDNQLFLEDMKFNAMRNREAAPFLSVIQDSTASPAARESAQTALNAINDAVLAHQEEVIKSHPESFMATVFKAQQRERLPEAEAESNPDAAFEYYKSHYWDNFDLSDPMLLRLNQPLYQEKLETYFDNLVIQRPDSIIGEIDRLAQKASANEETYKYFVWYMTIKYREPRIMGLDEVFVHMNDTYFASGKMDYWANAQLRKNIQDYADRLRNSLIGNKAPELIMQDENLDKRSLYDIDSKYTVLYFFDPDCQHCKLATPVLDALYDSHKFDMEVYAVSTDTSMVKMKDYISTMGLDWTTVNGPRTFTKPYYELYDALTTPTFYILDEDKNIIAKKLPVERIEEFLQRYEVRSEDE